MSSLCGREKSSLRQYQKLGFVFAPYSDGLRHEVDETAFQNGQASCAELRPQYPLR